MLSIPILSNLRAPFFKSENVFCKNNNKIRMSDDIFILSFKGSKKSEQDSVVLLEANRDYILYPVKQREMRYTNAKEFLKNIRYDNSLKKYTVLKNNEFSGDYISQNKEAIEYVRLLDNVKSPIQQKELVSAFCEETGFPDFEKVTYNIHKEIKSAVDLLSKKRNFDVAFIGYDSNCSVGRGIPLPGVDCDALFVIIEPKSDIPYIAEGTRWMLKDNINQRILSTPALSLPEVLTTDYIDRGLDLAQKTFVKAGFSQSELQRFSSNINDDSNDFVKAGEFNIRLAELLPNDVQTRDLFYKTAMFVELIRNGCVIENNFSSEFISKIKKSPLYKYSNIIRQEGLKNKIKYKHTLRKKLVNDFEAMDSLQKFNLVRDIIYSSFNIKSNSNSEFFENSSQSGINEMGNILDLYSALMNQIK